MADDAPLQSAAVLHTPLHLACKALLVALLTFSGQFFHDHSGLLTMEKNTNKILGDA